jgi:6,7-dimethyl-8-ribityllumazine synthase
MPTVYEGNFAPPPGRFALVAARFNHFVVEHLVGGCLDGLKRHGLADDAIDLIWVPGSYEAAKGVAHAALATGVPVIFGILTCDTLEQAINRAGAKAGNKGFEAALTALEMVNLLRQLPQR